LSLHVFIATVALLIFNNYVFNFQNSNIELTIWKNTYRQKKEKDKKKFPLHFNFKMLFPDHQLTKRLWLFSSNEYYIFDTYAHVKTRLFDGELELENKAFM
jgi:hypothetical protein